MYMSKSPKHLFLNSCYKIFYSQFYPIPVKAADRGRLSPGEIQAQLLHVMVDAAGAQPGPKIGLLTSLNRDLWARARDQLLKGNQRTHSSKVTSSKGHRRFSHY